MSERLPTRAPRARRSHASRTAQTRAKVKAAVVESIAELGFQRTTATEIARRAGVSWGAVQHHFGDKPGILLAVLEDSFERFAERLGEPPEGADLESRVAVFLARAWEHFGSPDYRSTFEILLNLPPPDASEGAVPWRTATLEAWNRIWGRFFGDARISRRRTVTLQQYTTSVLSGLAATKIVEGSDPARRRASLAFLEDTLVRELRGGEDRPRR